MAGKIYERLNFLTSNPKKYDAAVADVTAHADRKAKHYEIMHDLISHKMGHHLFTQTLINSLADKAKYHRQLAALLTTKPAGDRRKHLDQVYGLGIRLRDQKMEESVKKERSKKNNPNHGPKQIIVKLIKG